MTTAETRLGPFRSGPAWVMQTVKMSQPSSPLAQPHPWDLVATDYAAEVVPQFEPFARAALKLAGVQPGARIVDVATGPGTLAFLAAELGAEVEALDFSKLMVEQFSQRLAEQRVTGVSVRVGDGMDLPYDDASFDAGFSMFGLMFFPDRSRGFRELGRVLKPRAPAVVASWDRMDRLPLLAAVFEMLNELLPSPTPAPKGGSLPLVDPDVCRQEMTEGGFRDVVVHEVVATEKLPSVAEFVVSLARTSAPVVMRKKALGSDWTRVEQQLITRMTERFGAGPQSLSMPAHLTFGVRS